MLRQSIPTAVLVTLIVGLFAPAAAAIDADTLTAGLNTSLPEEEAYAEYVVTLADQGRLPRDLIESTFHWAREKPQRMKFPYFKRGLQVRASRVGVRLPDDAPPLQMTIQGQVMLEVLMFRVVVPGVTVVLEGADRRTVTDEHGRFHFARVPYGRYTLHARGIVGLLQRSGSARVILPPTPPSRGPVTININLL